MHKNTFIIKEVNWLADFQEHPIHVGVKIRSNHDVVPAQVKLLPNKQAEVSLHYPEKAITPGQACVVYQGERVLGGGWITNNIS